MTSAIKLLEDMIADYSDLADAHDVSEGEKRLHRSTVRRLEHIKSELQNTIQETVKEARARNVRDGQEFAKRVRNDNAFYAKYAGKTIAVLDSQVVASAETYNALWDELEALGLDDKQPVLMHIEQHKEVMREPT